MVKFDKLLVQKKLLSLFTISGSCGGLFIAVMKQLNPDKSIWLFGMQFFIFLILGLLTGIITMLLYKEDRSWLLDVNGNGDMLISKQRVYLISPAVMGLAYLINPGMDTQGKLTIAFLAGGVFILGLSGGIFDQFDKSIKNFLSLGIIPLALSFIFVFDKSRPDLIFAIWLFGFLYLLSCLLTLSSIQLFSNVLSSEDINVKGANKIRLFNYGLVLIFFLFCTVAIYFRKILAFLSDVFSTTGRWFYDGLAKFTEWLLRGPEELGAPSEMLPSLESELVDKPILENFFVIFLYGLFIVLVILMVVLIVFLLRKTMQNTRVGQEQSAIEFDEENEFIKDPSGFIIRRKYKYTKNGLAELKSMGEKIRYLYGFILERLHRRKINIKKSDTPEEIKNRILLYENGQRLEEIGFSELTEKYRRVRYGKKKVQFKGDILEKAEEYEKAISDISVDGGKIY